MQTNDRLLTPGEVAVLFRVDPRTVTRWAKAGRIGRIRTPGGHSRFRESEVKALLANGTPILEETFDYDHGVEEDAGCTCVENLVDAAQSVGFKEVTLERVTRVSRKSPSRHEVSFTPGEPFVSETFGPREGYVVGTCRHAVALSEWNAGMKNCERCGG